MNRRKKNEGKRSPEQHAATCSVMGCPFCVKIKFFVPSLKKLNGPRGVIPKGQKLKLLHKNRD